MRAIGRPFDIEKKRVYEAYKAVKSNGGAAGVDGQTIEQFEADLKNNLYKIWNRMSSGTYFPPPVPSRPAQGHGVVRASAASRGFACRSPGWPALSYGRIHAGN